MEIEQIKEWRRSLEAADELESFGVQVALLKALLDDNIHLHEIVSARPNGQYSPEEVLELSVRAHTSEPPSPVQLAEVMVSLRTDLTKAERNVKLADSERALHTAHQARWLRELQEAQDERDFAKKELAEEKEFIGAIEIRTIMQQRDDALAKLKAIAEECGRQSGATVGHFASRITALTQ